MTAGDPAPGGPDGAPGKRGARWPWILVPVLVTLSLQLPFIADPFGVGEMNGGSYVGVFAKIWSQHGFANLRGVPVSCPEFTPLTWAWVDLHHPPLFFWLSGWGTREWQVRLISVVALVLAAIALWHLLHDHFGPTRATIGATLLGVFPCTAFAARTSFEMSVIAAGLWAWICARRMDAARSTVATVGLSALAVVGTWIDWPFAFWIAAVAIIAPRRRWWKTVLIAAISSLIALAAVFAWMSWAREAPLLPQRPGTEIKALFSSRALTVRPATEVFLRDSLQRLIEGYGAATLILAACVLPFLFLKAPRLAAALVAAPLPFLLIFAQHSSSHIFFHAYLAPLIAAAIVSIPLPSRLAKIAGIAVAAGLVGWHYAKSFEAMREAREPIMRDLGVVVDQASADMEDDGRYKRLYYVFCNLPYSYPYYTRSPFMVPGAVMRGTVEYWVNNAGSMGVKYLLLRVKVEPPDAPVAQFFLVDPELIKYLEPFPKRRLEWLERRVPFPLTGQAYVIEECWQFDLR